ncbi:uncharacterized protein LOC128241391 [Mya arenaria]|uniref:uncharacterized protein LOC128241391 n=1 Tax=Mya arenaria TaxID=6604 RepID=UPI0022E3F384|nr:uncharacterized protein LOC128241391 [Mya arenaria]
MFLDDGFGTDGTLQSTLKLSHDIKQDLLDSGLIPKAGKSLWEPVQVLECYGEEIEELPDVLVDKVSLLTGLLEESRAKSTCDSYKRGFRRCAAGALSNGLTILLKKERHSGEFKKTSIEIHDNNAALMKDSSAGVEEALVKKPSFDVNDSGKDTQSQKGNVSSGSMTGREVGQRHRRSGETPQIAFTVSVSTKQIENLGKHQTIVFDHVITNVGSMYNPLTGIFHVPYSGTYVFSLTFNPGKLMESDTYLEIVQNGAQLADVLVENSARDSAGNYIG